MHADSRWLPWALGAAAAVLTGAAVVLGIGADAARRASDVVWPVGEATPRVVVVGIDAAAQEQYGPWPWSRGVQADLVDAIVDAGAERIGYDIVLTEAPDDPDAARLATALSRVPSVVATAYASVVRGPRGIFLGSEPLEPSADIAAAASVGHVVVPADADGVTRALPMVVQSPDGILVPAFALAVAGGSDADPLVRPDAVQVGGLTVPVEGSAAMRISWASGLGSADVVSAADVLAGAVDLDGATVLVGIADATIGDTHVTPLQPGATTPGVVVQAQAVSTILTSAWTAPMAWWMAALVVFGLGTVSAWAALRRAPWVAALIAVGCIAGYVLLALFLVPWTGVLPDLVRVPLGILAAAVAGGLVRIVGEQVARRRTTAMFARYVPTGVAERLLSERGEGALDAGTRVRAAVLFCDLRGFTPLAASLPPDEVRRALDLYYDYACARIFARGGTVMQFVGDEVFAVFGLPEPMTDPAASAREAATALQTERAELDARLAAAGLPALSFGIGVHVGDLVAATVGPAERRQFAVVGDAVNVGSRLCGAAGPGEIVVSVAAAEGTDAVAEALSVKGKDAPIPVLRRRPEPVESP